MDLLTRYDNGRPLTTPQLRLAIEQLEGVIIATAATHYAPYDLVRRDALQKLRVLEGYLESRLQNK